MTPGIAKPKKKPDARVGVQQDTLPFGWTTDADVTSFKQNADGSITAQVNVQFVSPDRKVFASGVQVVRLELEKKG